MLTHTTPISRSVYNNNASPSAPSPTAAPVCFGTAPPVLAAGAAVPVFATVTEVATTVPLELITVDTTAPDALAEALPLIVCDARWKLQLVRTSLTSETT